MKERAWICDRRFGEERALYHSVGLGIRACRFEGEEDGESALKESRDLLAESCFFDLRYPFWHTEGVVLRDSELTENCRAAFWYDRNTTVENSRLHGVKAFRECRGVSLISSEIVSPEFGWRSRDVDVKNCSLSGEYAFFEARDLRISNLDFKGKYSFQYVKNMVIRDSRLATKDAFWHAEGVTAINCEISGEYLGWYSKDLTLIGCHISGTQPLCYCRGLRLIDCTTDGCDLAFEYSSVRASVKGRIESVKNPRRGRIWLDEVGEIIREDAVRDCRARICVGGKRV